MTEIVGQTAKVPQLRAPQSWRLRFVFAGKDRVRLLGRHQRLLLGSGDDADVSLDDPTVSSRHCELRATERGLEIVDLGSKNGVYVGAGRVNRALLSASRFSFSLGCTTVEVEAKDAPRETESLGLLGDSSAMEEVRRSIVRFAPLSAPVLIRGESGTGKDVVARALHAQSGRPGDYFPLNVATLADGLLDAELFGHERGAFTGAVSGRTGLFEAAHEGTLFLDEVAEMSAAGQAKLLRVVEDGSVRALGSNRARQVQVRLVSATCAPLRERVREGSFRQDLYHRLSPLVIELPPLRERSGDIPQLSRHFLNSVSHEVGSKHITPAAMQMLKEAPWPGNVRELFGALYRAAALTDGDALAPGHLGTRPGAPRKPRVSPEEARKLLDIHGSHSAAARAAGVPRTTFRSILERAEARRLAR